MAQPDKPPAPNLWPRPLVITILTAFVLIDGLLWAVGFYYIFAMDMVAETHTWESQLYRGLLYITGALLFMLVVGWAWRWWVARGWIGGRATVRFGGA